MKFLLAIISLFIFINYSFAIKCFKCEGSDSNCHDLSNKGDGLQEDCNFTDHCFLKFVKDETIENGILTIRDCGSYENHLEFKENMTSICFQDFNRDFSNETYENIDETKFLFYCECIGDLCNGIGKSDPAKELMKNVLTGYVGKLFIFLTVFGVFVFGFFYVCKY